MVCPVSLPLPWAVSPLQGPHLSRRLSRSQHRHQARCTAGARVLAKHAGEPSRLRIVTVTCKNRAPPLLTELTPLRGKAGLEPRSGLPAYGSLCPTPSMMNLTQGKSARHLKRLDVPPGPTPWGSEFESQLLGETEEPLAWS